MGFRNVLGTVSRRSRWRRPLVFWDFQAGGLHDITDATLSLALFRVPPFRRWHRDAWERAALTPGDPCCIGEPLVPFGAAFVTSDDGNGYLLPDGPNRGKLDVPATLVSTVPAGLYRASIVAVDPYTGASFEVLSELVEFVGAALPAPALKPLYTADSGISADAAVPVSGAAVTDLAPTPDAPFTADSSISVDSPMPVDGLPAGAPPIPMPQT